MLTSRLKAYGQQSPIEGYEVVPIGWAVELSPGGPTVEVNGTVQEAVTKLSNDHPDFAITFNSSLAAIETRMLAKRELLAMDSDKPLDKRDSVQCCTFGTPGVPDIEDGIKYLRGVKGKPTRGPGPGSRSIIVRTMLPKPSQPSIILQTERNSYLIPADIQLYGVDAGLIDSNRLQLVVKTFIVMAGMLLSAVGKLADICYNM